MVAHYGRPVPLDEHGGGECEAGDERPAGSRGGGAGRNGMTWAMVDLDKRRIPLPASLTESSVVRAIPISARLYTILTMRRNDPDGKELPPAAFVFGNEIGQPVRSPGHCDSTTD